jgi:hypothetical protein
MFMFFRLWRICNVSHWSGRVLVLVAATPHYDVVGPCWSSMFPQHNNREAVEGSSDGVA